MIDQDRACPHEDFAAIVSVERITRDPSASSSSLNHAMTEAGPIAYCAEVRISCSQCGEPFRFRGMRAGLSPKEPMCSPDESAVRLPIRPASSDPDFGLGLPGYSIGYREP